MFKLSDDAPDEFCNRVFGVSACSTVWSSHDTAFLPQIIKATHLFILMPSMRETPMRLGTTIWASVRTDCGEHVELGLYCPKAFARFYIQMKKTTRAHAYHELRRSELKCKFSFWIECRHLSAPNMCHCASIKCILSANRITAVASLSGSTAAERAPLDSA